MYIMDSDCGVNTTKIICRLNDNLIKTSSYEKQTIGFYYSVSDFYFIMINPKIK